MQDLLSQSGGKQSVVGGSLLGGLTGGRLNGEDFPNNNCEGAQAGTQGLNAGVGIFRKYTGKHASMSYKKSSGNDANSADGRRNGPLPLLCSSGALPCSA